MCRIVPLLATGLLCLALGCNGGGAKTGPQGSDFLAGSVVEGPITGATVELYRVLDTGASVPFDPPLRTTTAGDGSYRIDTGGVTGPVHVVARGGSYTDEATGNLITKSVNDDVPLLGLAILAAGQNNAHVTPLTHFAALLAETMAADPDTDAELAIANAVRIVEDYFGVTGLLTTLPADLTAGSVSPGNAAEHGAAIAGVSQLAQQLGWSLPFELVDPLGLDGADGLFDGAERGRSMLPADAGGRRLRDAIRGFLDTNPRNASGLGSADVAVDDTIDAHRATGSPFSMYIAPPRVHELDRCAGASAGGSAIRLDGADLRNVQVLCGETTATILGGADTYVEFSTPAAPASGPVNVEVSDPATGLVTRLLLPFEYFAPGAPVITRLAPTHGPATGGTEIEIYGDRLEETSEVLVDGTPATVIRSIPPRLLVARVPAHATGTVQVVVRNGTTASAPASFEYRDRNVGQNLTDASVAGPWVAYALGHDHVAESFRVAVRFLNFDSAAGTVSVEEEMEESTPAVPQGVFTTDLLTVPYAVFPDATLWLDLTQGDDLAHLKGWLQDDADVFTIAQTAEGPETEMLIGVKQSSGRATGDLAGTYWLAGLAHLYTDPSGDREVVTVFGTAEFDGRGGGSAALLLTVDETGGTPARSLQHGTFTYSVDGDGQFRIDFEEGPFYEGQLTPSGDFAAGWVRGDSAEGEGDGLLVLARRAHGALPDAVQGSWYGASFGQEFYGSGRGDHAYWSELERSVADERGVELMEGVLLETSDDYPEAETEEEFISYAYTIEPSGRVLRGTDPLDVYGALGGSRRFFLWQPHTPGGGPDRPAVLGVYFRNAAHYSKESLRAGYNTVGIGQEFRNEADTTPPPGGERLEAVRSKALFDPAAPGVLEGEPFLASGTVTRPGGLVKVVERGPSGAADPSGEEVGGSSAFYTLVGDGRILVFHPSGGLADTDVDLLAVGRFTPHGEAALLRGPFLTNTAAGTTVLTRETTVAPPVSGSYNFTTYSRGFDTNASPPHYGFARTTRGSLMLNVPPGQFGGAADVLELWEDGTEATASIPVTGIFSPTSDGRIDLGLAGMQTLSAIATPDGSAVFFVDMDLSTPEISLGVALRAPSGAVAATGSFAHFQQWHSYWDVSAWPAWASVLEVEGAIRSAAAMDLGLLGGMRENTYPEVWIVGVYLPDTPYTIPSNGLLAWPAESVEGAMSDNGRYASLTRVQSGVVFISEHHVLLRQ